MQRRFLNIKELSDFLAVRPNTIYSWVSQRKIPCKKFGRLVRFDLKEIEEWIEQKSVVTYYKH